MEQWLRPDGQPQERIYSAISPLLINHGMGIIDRLINELDCNRTDMQILEL